MLPDHLVLLEPLIERKRISQPPIQIYISRKAELNAFALPWAITEWIYSYPGRFNSQLLKIR